MKLSYRGVAYESSPTLIETIETEATARYRGISLKLTAPTRVPLPQSGVQFSYRGTSYIGLR